MKIVILDYATLGYDLDLSGAGKYGTVVKYETTSREEAPERIKDADIVIVNKIKMNESVLKNAKKLKLICETATGYDNIDIDYCMGRGITVTNTPAYSSQCVAQVTVSMVCSLATHLSEYTECVSSGRYTSDGVANCLVPVYHELYGKTWGIIGYGNIGKAVGKIADAFGCRVIVNKRKPEEGCECVDLDTLLKESDIISIHCPLTDLTRGMIDKNAISKMKNGVIIVNVARGAVWDENAICEAVISGKIGGMGCDVFTKEPFGKDHPFYSLLDNKNVCLTPHMAWGSFESRTRCFDTILSNIEAFLSNNPKNVVTK
ncbi:MAG: hydroxyacid dehydrogenase [Clostridia bacterium]|nr:hydroxyacid dehydrogenase [Clostridia bacterium]